jgi:hypothetical protein
MRMQFSFMHGELEGIELPECPVPGNPPIQRLECGFQATQSLAKIGGVNIGYREIPADGIRWRRKNGVYYAAANPPNEPEAGRPAERAARAAADIDIPCRSDSIERHIVDGECPGSSAQRHSRGPMLVLRDSADMTGGRQCELRPEHAFVMLEPWGNMGQSGLFRGFR